MAYRATVYKTGIFPNVNDALKDKDIFPMDIETMDLLLNVAVASSDHSYLVNISILRKTELWVETCLNYMSQLIIQKILGQEIWDFSNLIASFLLCTKYLCTAQEVYFITRKWSNVWNMIRFLKCATFVTKDPLTPILILGWKTLHLPVWWMYSISKSFLHSLNT